ncbi:MAG: precorrin-2 dehydrogenase/sirohydrochlorin ferrochelatase family protein [Fastidiosipilaceae bacterium]
MGYLPLFIKMDAATSLVLGGGEVALRKARAILKAGGKLIIVADSFVEGWLELDQADVLLKKERITEMFTERPLEFWKQYKVVVAATDNPLLNEKISESAARAGCLVNNVSARGENLFEFGAQIRRGAACIAIHSAGNPALSAQMRRRLEEIVPQEWGDAVDQMAKLRLTPEFQQLPLSEQRARLRELALKSIEGEPHDSSER